MKRTLIILIVVSAVLGGLMRPCAATLINLDLYNTEALLNSDAFTPLLGTTNSGDLVQVILLGADNTINAPDIYGNPGGDDTLLSFGNPTNSWLHVGFGVPFNPDQGLLDVFPLQYDSSLVGSNVFVRFWNAATPGAATYYGNSTNFTLLAGTGPGSDQAAWDFVPTGSSPHITDQPFNALVIPEPSNLFLFGLIAWGYWLWRRRTKLGIA
jgi:hypothetical protein